MRLGNGWCNPKIEHTISVADNDYRISGSVFEDNDNSNTKTGSESGIDNVTVRLFRDTNGDGSYQSGTDTQVGIDATTASGGTYSFSNLTSATYFVLVDASDSDLSGHSYGGNDAPSQPNPRTVVINNANGMAEFPFARLNGSISGTLYLDADGDNSLDAEETTRLPANISVQLLNSSGSIITTTQTNGSGNYTFTNVPTGTGYQVQVDTSDPQIPVAYVIGTTNPLTGITVTANSTTADQNFGFDASGYGDAPNSYLTTNVSNGARHIIVNGLKLGTNVPDSDTNGQPNASANGDDTNGTDDEDGVSSFPILTTTSTSYSVNVNATNTTGSTAKLVGWIDFNKSGTFEASEGESVDVPKNSSDETVTLNWNSLSGLTTGDTYARFRLSTDNITASTPSGIANNGEVEDYKLTITIANKPKLLLVKRITAIHGDRTQNPNDGTALNTFVNDPSTADDNLKWPEPSTYFKESYNGGKVKPGDEVEYTIYFLNTGAAAKNVTIVRSHP